MSGKNEHLLDADGISELAETFGLLSDPTRLAIVLACRKGPAQPSQIAAELGVSASLVSHHLRLLRATQMVRSERRGREIHYALADDCVSEMLALMIGHILEHGHDHTPDRRAAPDPLKQGEHNG